MPTLRHITVLLFILLGSGYCVSAQDWEVGAWGGISNYFGDLNTHGSFEFVGPGAGFFTRYNINKRFVNRIGLDYGNISGSDAASSDAYERSRNLSFRSNIIELNDVIEFNFFKYDKRKRDLAFTPYICAGVGVFYFNPTATYEGKTYSLQPLGTEGQNDPESGKGKYSRVSMSIIGGGGFKYSFHPAWCLGVEFGFRKTLTDYIDDVSTTYPSKVVSFTTSNSIARALSDRSGEVGESFGRPGKQRGDNKNKDSYMFLGLSLSYTILKEHCPKISKIH